MDMDAEMEMERERTEQDLSFARACIALLKGVVDRPRDESLWLDILKNRDALKEYLDRIGLGLTLSEEDGYAYLYQREDIEGMPRLVQRRPLGYGLSMLLVFLRRRMGEFDSSMDDEKLILSAGEMRRGLELFLPAVRNEERFIKQVEKDIQRAVDMGVLRKTKEEGEYEVRPILRSLVTGAWLQEFHQRLKEYEAYGEMMGDRVMEAPAEGEEEEDGLVLNGWDGGNGPLGLPT